jgi:hypothetical protein
MAMPVCSKCGKGSFAVTVTEPADAVFKAAMIHCSFCGTVAGVQDSYNLAKVLTDIEAKIDRIAARLEVVARKIGA